MFGSLPYHAINTTFNEGIVYKSFQFYFQFLNVEKRQHGPERINADFKDDEGGSWWRCGVVLGLVSLSVTPRNHLYHYSLFCFVGTQGFLLDIHWWYWSGFHCSASQLWFVPSLFTTGQISLIPKRWVHQQFVQIHNDEGLLHHLFIAPFRVMVKGRGGIFIGWKKKLLFGMLSFFFIFFPEKKTFYFISFPPEIACQVGFPTVSDFFVHDKRSFLLKVSPFSTVKTILL